MTHIEPSADPAASTPLNELRTNPAASTPSSELRTNPAASTSLSELRTNPAADTRNLTDQFKGLPNEAVVEELDKSRADLHIAIENWTHDFNIGSIVRTANAFNVAAVHIIGRRRWNRRGAMKTEAYQHVYHHTTIEEFEQWAAGVPESERAVLHLDHPGELAPSPTASLPVIGVDILPGVSKPIEGETLPNHCVLLFGSEGDGLSAEAQQLALSSSGKLLHITQYGSTRSVNAGHAAAITMFAWSLQNRI
jgi:tRNA G18 (ribose-2'-O)-methylase SpoU